MTDELLGVFEYEGVVLESAFSVDAEPPVVVFVCQVNLLGTRPLAESGRVVKFSKKQDALPRAECLKLATPQHYRHNFEDAEGIHDELEAKHHEDLRRYLTPFVDAPLLRPDLRHASGQVTYALDHFWMFCTSVKPSSDYHLRQIAERLSTESVTTISEPSELARELGATVAAHAARLDVKLTPLDEVMKRLSHLHGLGTVVWVHHGPVLYSDDSQRLVSSFPDQHRAIPVAFIKRRKFEWEREYRFTVQVRGAPSAEVVYLPVSAALRRLVHIEWEAASDAAALFPSRGCTGAR